MAYERSRQIEQRFERAVELITENSHSARQLTEALDVSRPTVHRIIVELKRRGYVIRAVRDEYGWRYERLSSPQFRDPIVVNVRPCRTKREFVD